MKHSTFHAINRAKERQNKSASKAEKEFAVVLRHGKRISDFGNATQRKYLMEKELPMGSRVYIYEDYCYIFDAKYDRCITTYLLPKWFNRGTRYAGKERIRNAKTYGRLNPIDYWKEEAA